MPVGVICNIVPLSLFGLSVISVFPERLLELLTIGDTRNYSETFGSVGVRNRSFNTDNGGSSGVC